MSDTPATKDDVRKATEPDSSQINADDLIGAPITVTIERVSKGTREQPINIHLVGYDRVFRPCKTMLRILRHDDVYTVDPENWLGKQMTLYCDPEVKMGGERTGGIRISHLSGLDATQTFMMTKARGRKGRITIHPIATLSHADKEYIEQTKKEIAGAGSLETLEVYKSVLKQKPPTIRDVLRPVYIKREKELNEPSPTGSPEGKENES